MDRFRGELGGLKEIGANKIMSIETYIYVCPNIYDGLVIIMFRKGLLRVEQQRL